MVNCRSRIVLLCVLNLLLAACGKSSSSTSTHPAQALAAVPTMAQTESAPGARPTDAVIWSNPTDASRSVILGANGEAGVDVFGLDGRRLASHAKVQLDLIGLSAEFSLRGKPEAVIVGYDRKAGALAAFVFDSASLGLTPVSARTLNVDSEVNGLCTFRSPTTGSRFVFVATDDGHLNQWELYERDGKVDGRVARTLPIGVGAGYCTVDERTATVYVTEETVGIWKLPAEPETDAERQVVDLVGPRGHLAEEVKGIAVYPLGEKGGYLLAADVAAGRINVYTIDSKFVGSFGVNAQASTLKEAEGLAAGAGTVVVADQNDGATRPTIRLFSWDAIADRLKLERATQVVTSGGQAAAAPIVMPTVETDPVNDYGDAADDPAIWVHPSDPARSVIIGAQKKRGLYVYDLAGKTLQVLSDGRMNNVDLRQGFRLGGTTVAIVAASNRTARTLALYKVDPATRRLSDVAEAPIPTGFRDPYGLCMYRDAKSGDFYVFMNESDNGAYKQWRLVAKGDRVAAEIVREFTVGTQAEGCAADDETGALYIAEEDVGLWRYEAAATGGEHRVAIDSTGKGNLKADVEGVAIYHGANGAGYVVVSNQGDNNYALYRREGRNEFLGHFSVVANPALGIDGASETDGLDVIGTPLGAAFPHGVLVVQDGRNISPSERQNFKLVPWQHVAQAMSLR
jgi:3-phytase